jgi:hypothetical protein
MSVAAASSPITFEDRGAGRLVAKLGIWEVGEVTAFPMGDRVKAHWRVAPMHDAAAAQQRRFPARDVEAAKRRLEQHLLDWIEGSGLQFIAREQIRAFRAGSA